MTPAPAPIAAVTVGAVDAAGATEGASPPVRIHVGTSGWHYEHWRGPFYPPALLPSQWLAFYAAHFRTVEINSSFYRLPTPAAVRAWSAETPPGFLFSVKASRFITHMKKLKDPDATCPPFLDVAQGLGEKLGPVLFQLPPRWHADTQRLESFLAEWPRELPCAFEFRDPDWHRPEILEILRRHNAAFCVFDLGGVTTPLELTADFAYLRLHGPGAPYCGRYGHAALETWADRIRRFEGVKAVYVYFDNDQAGHAVADAMELRELLGDATFSAGGGYRATAGDRLEER